MNEPSLIREALVARSEALVIQGGSSAGLARLIGHGILTNRGQEWRASRSALQARFSSSAVDRYLPLMADRVPFQSPSVCKRVRPQ